MTGFAPASVLAALLFAAAPAPSAESQPVQPMNFLPAISGDYFPIASNATQTTCHIYVRYPLGYTDNPDEKYPIVYLLDGDSAFPLLAAQHLFLTIDDKIPEAVVVGISYGSFEPEINLRHIDYGPKSEAFQTFLSTQLIPRVEASTRADPSRRILVGQSFGGAFVLYSALTEPDLFWGRIASNPSFRLHGPVLWEDPAPAKRDDLKLFVISGTENAAEARQQALDWAVRWNEGGGPWSVETINIPGGTHSADIANAYRAALRRLFAAPSPTE